MDNAETARMREEILRELEPLLYENLAAAEWGRALVRVQRAPVGDRVRVVGIDIEDLVGDEGKVDAALAGRDARALLPLLADATVALAATCGVEVDDIEGGTILRRPGGGFAWLPGLVHAPSAGFERLRDAATERVLGKQDALARRGVADRFEVDLERGSISFVTGERREARGDAARILRPRLLYLGLGLGQSFAGRGGQAPGGGRVRRRPAARSVGAHHPAVRHRRGHLVGALLAGVRGGGRRGALQGAAPERVHLLSAAGDHLPRLSRRAPAATPRMPARPTGAASRPPAPR